MQESFIMEDGTIVEFYSNLSYNGIHVEVLTKLKPEQYTQFKKELKRERDVVTIRLNNKN
jgi:hypothetical protein